MLSNTALKAFNDGTDQFIATQVLPVVNVDQQTNAYPTITQADWMRIPNTIRSPGAKANRITFSVSTDNYQCKNYALAAEIPVEQLANEDSSIATRMRYTQKVVRDMRADLELRVANLITSASNLGSGAALTGGDKFSDYTNSDPIAFVNTGHTYIEDATGFHANTCIMDKDTFKVLRRHPQLIDLIKYTGDASAGINRAQMAQALDVDTLLVGSAVYNQGLEGQASSNANIWGNNLVLAYVQPNVMGLEVATLGATMLWRNPELGNTAFAVMRDRDVGAGRRQCEVIEAQAHYDNKIMAAALGYALTATL